MGNLYQRILEADNQIRLTQSATCDLVEELEKIEELCPDRNTKSAISCKWQILTRIQALFQELLT